MKKLFLLAILLLVANIALADNYTFGDTARVSFTVIDTTYGEPVDPDSIQIEIYHNMGTIPVVANIAMTNWNSTTGMYYHNFAIPDTMGAGIFSPKINYGALGQEWEFWVEDVVVPKSAIFDGTGIGIMAHNRTHDDVDTTFFTNSVGDTLGYTTYSHADGYAGDSPDSSANYDY